jgi:hypothetical protein
MKKYQCIDNLIRKLSDAGDEVMSCANAYFGENGEERHYRVLISDLTSEHQFDEAYIPLLVQMLNERTDDIVFEDLVDEIVAYNDQQKENQTEMLNGLIDLDFPPKRMNYLLNKALDWLGECENGADLYDTLKTKVGMTDEEITAAGFDLSEHYNGFLEDESSDITMQ